MFPVWSIIILIYCWIMRNTYTISSVFIQNIVFRHQDYFTLYIIISQWKMFNTKTVNMKYRLTRNMAQDPIVASILQLQFVQLTWWKFYLQNILSLIHICVCVCVCARTRVNAYLCILVYAKELPVSTPHILGYTFTRVHTLRHTHTQTSSLK